MKVKDWTKYPNFSEAEFKDHTNGKVDMEDYFMDALQKIRMELGVPMQISSGYRSAEHPIEKSKAKPGEHSYGCAADVTCSGIIAVRIVELALKHDIKRIGVSQRAGVGRYIHLGMGDREYKFPQAIWSY